jgi:hypothetical protein
MVVGPRIEVKAVEGDALCSHRDGSDARTHVAVESVLVHAEIGRRVAKPDEAGNGGAGRSASCTAIRAAPCWMAPKSPKKYHAAM